MVRGESYFQRTKLTFVIMPVSHRIMQSNVLVYSENKQIQANIYPWGQ